jgi:hypothetical protein
MHRHARRVLYQSSTPRPAMATDLAHLGRPLFTACLITRFSARHYRISPLLLSSPPARPYFECLKKPIFTPLGRGPLATAHILGTICHAADAHHVTDADRARQTLFTEMILRTRLFRRYGPQHMTPLFHSRSWLDELGPSHASH